MYNLPTTIEIEGHSFPIAENGDFRMVLECFSCLEDQELSEQERCLAALMIFYGMKDLNEINRLPDLEQATKEMYKFFEADIPEAKKGQDYRLIDWDKDAAMICSAVNKVANKEVRSEEYLHWWTFMGYYMAIGESSLSTVVGIRSKIVKGKKMEKWEREFRAENSQYFEWDSRSAEQKADDEWLKSVWNKE